MFDLMKLTPIQLDQFLHMQSLVERDKNAAAKVRALRAYYDGEHPVLLTQRQKEYLGELVADTQFTFAHNLVRSIVDTLRERLSVTGFEVEGDSEDNAIAAQLWQWWTANQMSEQQIRHYRRALRDGYSYIICDWDSVNNIPRWTLHKRDDGTTGVMLHRDPEDENRVLFANRYFYTFDPLKPGATGKERKTTYLPGEIRKYIKGADGRWEPVLDDGDPSWPLPWVDSTGAPLGIPVFEFQNPGGSEVEQIIGLQNALNKTWLDLLAAADASGFPLIAVEYNSDGKPFSASTGDPDLEGEDEMRLSPGRLIEVDDARVHRLEAANLTPMIETMWTIVQAVSGVARTPAYYLRPVGGGDVPSGEALKQLESGLVKRAMERQLVFGTTWTAIMWFSWRLAQTFGIQAQTMPVVRATAIWEDPNVRNELADAQTATIHKALNVPDETLWAKLGYTPQQIADFQAMAQAQEAAKIATIAGQLRTMQTQPATQPGGNAPVIQ